MARPLYIILALLGLACSYLLAVLIPSIQANLNTQENQNQHYSSGSGSSMDDLAEKNRKHWDNAAGSYDSQPWQQKLIAQVTEEIQSRLEWIGVDWVKQHRSERAGGDQAAKSVRVLDYACGPGTVSRALTPYATDFRGIDISENMVKEYNARAMNQGFSPAQMYATHGDLLVDQKPSSSISGPDFYNFDLAVVDLGFHHFEDPALASKRLVERLKPGKGVLLIIDFVQHEQDKNPAEHIIAHHGFSKEKTEEMFKKAGCVDVDYVVVDDPLILGDELGGRTRKVFMIRGRRGS
ncbi:MAG: hypothetical protein M1830_002227 [Pleopsidium flavum]|nr:MAG: hypothetical protein M1830_002227 [Pleopsidium flavum]